MIIGSDALSVENSESRWYPHGQYRGRASSYSLDLARETYNFKVGLTHLRSFVLA